MKWGMPPRPHQGKQCSDIPGRGSPRLPGNHPWAGCWEAGEGCSRLPPCPPPLGEPRKASSILECQCPHLQNDSPLCLGSPSNGAVTSRKVPKLSLLPPNPWAFPGAALGFHPASLLKMSPEELLSLLKKKKKKKKKLKKQNSKTIQLDDGVNLGLTAQDLRQGGLISQWFEGF